MRSSTVMGGYMNGEEAATTFNEMLQYTGNYNVNVKSILKQKIYDQKINEIKMTMNGKLGESS